MPEVTFKRLIEQYRRLRRAAQADAGAAVTLGLAPVIRDVLLTEGARGNIIDLYNAVFIPRMKASRSPRLPPPPPPQRDPDLFTLDLTHAVNPYHPPPPPNSP